MQIPGVVASRSVLNVVVVKEERDSCACHLGSRRAGRSRRLFNLSKALRQCVVRKPLNKEGQELGRKPPGSASKSTDVGTLL